ncbi:MAG: hypothetical protein RIR77_339 [Planctomycetota bacterium]|jgi:hypothetical protein
MAGQGEAREIRAIRGGKGAKTTPAPSRAISYADRTSHLRYHPGASESPE